MIVIAIVIVIVMVTMMMTVTDHRMMEGGVSGSDAADIWSSSFLVSANSPIISFEMEERERERKD